MKIRITRKSFWVGLLCAVSLVALVLFYYYWLSPTRIAFINYQPIALQGLSQANDNPMIKLYSISEKEVGKSLGRYDIIIMNAMGLRITAEQREALQELANKGVPIYTGMATNPENAIGNFSVDETALLQQWMTSGGKKNYRSLLSFLRHNVDGKIIFTGEVAPAEQKLSDYLYIGEEEYESVKEYENALKTKGLWIEGAPRIIVTGQITDPTELVNALRAEGRYNVYALSVFTKLLEFVMEIEPSAVINLAHGRLGDDFVAYCETQNVLYFDPLTVNEEVETWEADKQGMAGGFLSQSVVTPEIDGAIRTSVVFAQKKDKHGLLQPYAVPDRLKTFVETVGKYMDLRTKPNSEKKIAIVYFKGWGDKPMIASGLDVLPSLNNLIDRLVSEGYKRENIALRMQPLAGQGKDVFQITHGVDQDPPEEYIECYEWIRNEFKADALIHFGTHGSLEFTPHKQVALSSNDWPDKLIGNLPHFYVYTIDNVGEAMTAKRRSYAQIISYLTAPYHESSMPKEYAELEEALRKQDGATAKECALQVGLARDLQLAAEAAGGEEELAMLEDFAGEIMSEKVNGDNPYTIGEPYAAKDVKTSVFAMAVDPIAYSRYNLDKLQGKTTLDLAKNRLQFEDTYIRAAKQTVEQLYNGAAVSDELICKLGGVTAEQLAEARAVIEEQNAPKGMLAMMLAMSRKQGNDSTQQKSGGMAEMMKKMGSTKLELPEAKNNPIAKIMRHQMRKMLAKKDPTMMLDVARKMGAPEEALKKMEAALMKNFAKQEEQEEEPEEGPNRELANAIDQLETTLKNVGKYKALLTNSGQTELEAISAALNGAYTPPSPGGDPIANPNTLPTGRNLYAVNAEATPSEDAWEKACELVKATLADYRKKNDGEWPRKVSFTLWSGEFIQTSGATIAQVLYMLGVEPVRDRYGRVTDLKLIAEEELGRPRIDVLVQTSGQLRDLAASRLYLISRAVQMAAEAPSEQYANYVREGVDESERYLVDRGVAPKQARKLSARRVFGGLNGGYGSGIQSMLENGSSWRDESEVADRYLYNMGAYYGDEDEWESYEQDAFAAAMTRTDVVIQPRQNNSWGALSLDHVYEFMGGLNLAVRNVTGKDPEAYFSDYRNRNGYKAQEAKAAIGVEARTKMLNEAYIRESLAHGATPTDQLAEMVKNTYGWNVMKPKAIDPEMWQEIYEIYVEDKYNLGVEERLSEVNPAALREITGAMIESADRGYWAPSEAQRSKMASVNKRLQPRAETAGEEASEALKMEKQTMSLGDEESKVSLSGLAIGAGVIVLFVVAVLIMRRRRSKQ